MPMNGFYPISLASVLVLAWRHSLSPLSALMLLAVVWANVAIHEFGHAAAVCWTGGTVTGLWIRPWHGKISFRQSDRLGFAIIALAGPAAGIVAGSAALCVLGMVAGSSITTTFGAALTVILWAGICDNCLNLLPVWVLDGKQFVRALREWRMQQRLLEWPLETPEASPAPPAVVAVHSARPSRSIPTCRLRPIPAASI